MHVYILSAVLRRRRAALHIALTGCQPELITASESRAGTNSFNIAVHLFIDPIRDSTDAGHAPVRVSLVKKNIKLLYGFAFLDPPGITRHVINCGRVLHVNAPLSLLRSSLVLEEKERQLEAMLGTRHKRVYQEATIQFEN
jgi:hypothetical protein